MAVIDKYTRSIQDTILLNVRKLKLKERAWPNFIIIGCQKCGTTSLYDYLCQHPQIIPAYKKEVKYFDLFSNKGLDYYRAHFPILKSGELTGEATPDYILYEEAAKSIARHFKDIKLIVVMRNPVDRAISHFNFNVSRGFENLSLKEALDQEENRIGQDKDIEVKGGFISTYFREYSYQFRGRYLDQIQMWQKYFDADQFHFLSSEDLNNRADSELNKIFNFLGLEDFSATEYPKLNITKDKESEIPDSQILRLKDYFKPLNEQLFSSINGDFSW